MFSPDGKLLVTGSYDGLVRVWDSDTSEEMYSPLDHAGGGHQLVFDPSGMLLITGAADGKIRFWDVATGAQRYRGLSHAAPIVGVAISDDGQSLVTGAGNGDIRIWRMPPIGQYDQTLSRYYGAAHDVEFSADGRILATSGMTQIWDAVTGLRVGPPIAQSESGAVAFNPGDSSRHRRF